MAGTSVINANRVAKIAMDKINLVIYDGLIKTCRDMLSNAKIKAAYHNLTGNTLTSITCGIYKEGKLKQIVNIREAEHLKDPTRKKLSSDMSRGVRFEDYDSGEEVFISKKILSSRFMQTDMDYGYNTARRFLRTYVPKSKNCVVMTTGTEYSTFIENTKKLNVLTETQLESPQIFGVNILAAARKYAK